MYVCAPFMLQTSKHLKTRLIPSSTTRSRQYEVSTMFSRNLPPYHLFQYFVLSFQRKERDNREQSLRRGGTGQGYIRSWLKTHIVQTWPFRRG